MLGFLFCDERFSHVTLFLRDLHWLPVAARIRFKMMVLAFKAVNGTAPFYSKHWSDHTTQREHFAHLHKLASWYRHH